MPIPSISERIRDQLKKQATQADKEGIKALFATDNERCARFSFTFEDIHFDFSKTHITDQVLQSYTSFANELDFEGRKKALFAGEKINITEQRSVLHTLLRDSNNHGVATVDSGLGEEAAKALQDFKSKYSAIRSQLSARKSPIKNILHVGIGGSSLGTQLVFEALKKPDEAVKIHFLGNIDGHQLDAVLAECDIDSTLVIGVSKTFGTAETLQNIRSIGGWYESNGGKQFLNHVYAVTANPQKAGEFGVPESNIVTFPEWVGGRYSVWSSVSLSAALVLGMDGFSEFLQGAAEMDEHFLRTEPQKNLSFIAAALDHYYVNFFNSQSRAIFAYDYRLRSLVDYLQQLETESNGKDRQLDGHKVDQLTSPVVWGGVGTDVQHSVFQMLHQGTSLIPAEFILTAQADHSYTEHHQELLANGLAQTAALLSGQDLATVKALHADEGLSSLAEQAKIFSGNRPSTTILMQRLTPKILGALLAFYEQRTFCFGVFCNINSYDQMGVELGKRLATQVRPLINSVTDSTQGSSKLSSQDVDPSTLGLLEALGKFQ